MSSQGSLQSPPLPVGFRVTVELLLTQTILPELLRHQPGDHLTTDKALTPAAVVLRINGCFLGKASICQLSNHWAVRISQLGA